MASLANQTISSTYDGLIKTSTDQPVGVSGVQLLEDGVGNTLALSVGRANQGVTVTGTLTATTLTGTVSATSVLADGVTATTQSAGDNSTKVATTAYVDAAVTAEDLDFAGDSGTGAVDLDSQTFTIAGTANEIETVASGQTVTIGLPSSVTVGTLSATTLGGTLSTAAQPNITSVGTLSSLAVSGNLTVDTNTLYVDAASNNVGIGTSSPATKLEVQNGFISTYHNVNLNGAGYGIEFYTDAGGSKNTIATISPYQKGTTRSGDIIISTSNNGAPSERMRISPIGNVGIGTSSPNSYSGYTTLTLNGSTGGFLDYEANGTRVGSLLFNASSGVLKTETAIPMIFATADTERMRILQGGGITFNGDTAAANALDDYEEGTWTVVVSDLLGNDATVSAATRSYTKIGDSFIINCSVTLSNKGSSVAGALVYISLPFTPSIGRGNVAYYANLTSPAGAIMAQHSGAYAFFPLHNNGNDSGALTFGELTNTSRLDFVLTGKV